MRRFLCCLALVVQIVTWVPATSRLLNDHLHQTGSVVSSESSLAPYSLKQEPQGKMITTSEAANNGGVNKLGSRPPNCEHKCDGCVPCEAIQVPTITSRFGVQYTNYEPESWKCKCGPSFYSP